MRIESRNLTDTEITRIKAYTDSLTNLPESSQSKTEIEAMIKQERDDETFIAAVSRDIKNARLERIEASVTECLEILRGKE